MFFDEWSDIGRVVLLGALGYVGMVAALRLAGKRTLAKLNAFDLVVTVALGSVLATIALSSEVSLSEGVAAIALLVLAQLLVAWASVRSTLVERIVKSEPTVLVHHGELLEHRLREHRVGPEEVRQAVRSNGIGAMDQVGAVVLETDGSLSVIPGSSMGSGDALVDVDVPD